MKKLLLITLISLLLSCSNDDDDNNMQPTQQATKGKVTFYMAPASGKWNLLIDGTDMGLLNESTSAPACEEAGFKTVELSFGTHTADAKSLDGYAWGNPKSFTVVDGCIVVKVK